MNTTRIRKGKQYYEKPQNGCFARRRFSTQSQEPEKLLLTFQADKIKCCQIGCLLFHNNDIVIMILLQWYCLQRGCAEEFAPAGREIGCHFYAKIYAVPCKSLIVKHITKKKYCDLWNYIKLDAYYSCLWSRNNWKVLRIVS